ARRRASDGVVRPSEAGLRVGAGQQGARREAARRGLDEARRAGESRGGPARWHLERPGRRRSARDPARPGGGARQVSRSRALSRRVPAVGQAVYPGVDRLRQEARDAGQARRRDRTLGGRERAGESVAALTPEVRRIVLTRPRWGPDRPSRRPNRRVGGGWYP